MFGTDDDGKTDLLRGVWLFARCRRRELRELARVATIAEVEAGTVLAREGRVGDQFFVVVRGRASVSRGGTDIGTVFPGSFFGEIALLDGGLRVATVTATEPMTVLVMTRDEFSVFFERMSPAVARRMLEVMAERLRSADARLADGTVAAFREPTSRSPERVARVRASA